MSKNKNKNRNRTLWWPTIIITLTMIAGYFLGVALADTIENKNEL